MKIQEWYTGEPSSLEYGRAIDQGRKRMRDRYAPFDVNLWHGDRSSLNSNGWNIGLEFGRGDFYQWIAQKPSTTFGPKDLTLYGPMDSNKGEYVETVFDLAEYKDKEVGKFKSIDQLMSYLFTNFSHLRDDLDESWRPVEFDETTGEYYSRPGNEFDGIDPQTQNNDEELNEGLQYLENVNSRKGIKVSKTLTEAFNYNEVQSGDLVNFGKYGNLYVCNAEYSDNAFWVTDEESDRNNRKASGWTIDKELAEYIVDEDDDLDEALGKDYSHIPEVKQINYSNNKNGNLLPYLDCNAFKAALEETGLEAFKIKSARLKGVSLGDLKDEFGGRGMQPWKWTHDFDSSVPMGQGNEFDIFFKGEFPKVEEKLQNEKEDTSEEKEDAKLIESEDGWVKRFNWADKYYKDDYVISAIPGYPDATKIAHWHVEKVRPNGSTISHLGNYSSLEKAKEVVDALPSKQISEDLEVPTLEGPNEGAEYGLSELLNIAIQHELETVNEYNVLALNARAEGFDDIASVIDEINTEENKHIGQLQELLKLVSPNAQAIVAGETEASDDLVSIEESFDKIPVITFKGKRTFDTEEEAWEFKKSLGDKYRAIHKVEYPDMTFYIVDFEED